MKSAQEEKLYEEIDLVAELRGVLVADIKAEFTNSTNRHRRTAGLVGSGSSTLSTKTQNNSVKFGLSESHVNE